MRICLVVRALPVHRLGGLELHTWDLATALAAHGHEVDVVTSRHPDGAVESSGSERLRVHYCPRGRPGDYTIALFRWLDGQVEKLDSQRRFDIVHAQEFAGLFLRRRPGRFACTVHGTMFSEVPLDRRYWQFLKLWEKAIAVCRYSPRLLLHPFFLRMLSRADTLLVDSEFSWRELVGINPALGERLNIVPLGVDPERYPGALQDHGEESRFESGRPLTIALLGRLQRMKGMQVVIDAGRLLHERAKPFQMLIGGTGDYVDEARRRLSGAGLLQKMVLCGPIEAKSVSDFLGKADLFLFPDLTQPAFGLVAVEAMMHGLPVLAARSGAIPEIVTDEVGWLYQPWNYMELIVLIEDIIRHPEELRRRAEKTRAHASQYTAARMAREVEGVYRRLIDNWNTPADLSVE